MSADISTQQIAKDVLSKPMVQGSYTANRQAGVAAAGKALPPEAQQQQQVSPEQLQQVVEQLNQHVQSINRDLHFSVDDQSGRTVIRVVNSETEELIRQIPSEEVLRISRNLQQQMDELSGLLVETSA